MPWDASADCQVYRADGQNSPESSMESHLPGNDEPLYCLIVQALAVINPCERLRCRTTADVDFAASARENCSSFAPPMERAGICSGVSEIDIGLWSCLCTVTTWPVDVTHMGRYSRDQEFAPIPPSRTAYGWGGWRVPEYSSSGGPQV